MKACEQLRAKREKSGYSQVEVARRLGISREYLHQIEVGKIITPKSYETLEGLCRLYGVGSVGRGHLMKKFFREQSQ